MDINHLRMTSILSICDNGHLQVGFDYLNISSDLVGRSLDVWGPCFLVDYFLGQNMVSVV